MNKNRQQLLAILAISAVAILVADRVVITPLIDSWKERSERIGNLKQSVTQAAILIEREDSLREQWREMKENMLPHSPSAAENSMLKAFERWARESRVSVAGIRPQWKRQTERMTLECNADINGDLEALARFLKEIETDEAGFRIQRVELSARNDEGSQLFMSIQVSGLPQEAEAL